MPRPENNIQQCAQIPFQHEPLNLLHEVVVALEVAGASGVHASRGPAKQNRLRNVGQSRKHIAGGVYDILDAGELERLEVIVLAIGINDQRIEDTSGRVDDVQPLENLILAVIRGQEGLPDLSCCK